MSAGEWKHCSKEKRVCLWLNGKPKQRKDGGIMTDDEFCFRNSNFKSLHDIENVVKHGTRKEIASKFQKLLGSEKF